MKFDVAIKNGCQELKKNNISSALLDSEILLSKVIKKDRKFILLNLDKELNQSDQDNFKDLIIKRSKGKPIAHLTGIKSFWKFDFKVNNKVLIPRPDSEIIIEQVLKIYKNKNKLNFLEVGIGSGCITLSLLKEKKFFLGTGVDLSKDCIKICKDNAENLGVNSRLRLIKSDVDNLNFGKYDLIISNPPYIKKFDLKKLDKEVKNYEPRLALDGGLEGISIVRKVIKKSSELIKTPGKLVLEIGCDQTEQIKKMLNKEGFYINKIVKDLAKKNRCIISTKKWTFYMVTFRNNNNVRRNNFRRNDRSFKSNIERPKYGSNFSKNENFQRKSPGRNNHNASKLIEKYSNLAREALSSGDKILSENYFQHADHFTRILNDQDAHKKPNSTNNKINDTQQNTVDVNKDQNEIVEKKQSIK